MKQYKLKQNHDYSPQTMELSLGQKELWFIHSMGGLAQSAYNEALVYSLKGYLQVNVLKKAFSLLIEKHGMLRTSIKQDEEANLHQFLHEEAELDFISVKMSDEDEINEHVTQTLSKPFNLQKAPLMRVSLVKISEDEHLLVIVLHHIITDGTSFVLFINDLNNFYNQLMRNETAEPLKTKSNYHNKLVYEQETFVSKDYLEQVDKVAEELKGYSALNFLTTPVAHDSMDLFSGNRVYFTLDKALCERMNRVAQGHRATVFHFLYAAYSLLLRQYTRSNDILIGVPFANREADPEREILGYFINTMPIRQILEEKDTFPDLLAKVKTGIFASLCRQNTAFEHLSSKLSLPRKALGQHPLIQTLFVWGSTEKLQLKFEGINAVQKQDYFNYTSKFDLSLFMLEENKESVVGYFEYRDCLFEKEMIEAFARSFTILLENILNNPQANITSYSLLNEIEKAQMKEKFFTAKLDRLVTKSLPDLFSETAARYPQNVGLVFGTNRYDYHTIEMKSNQWANYIRHTYKQVYGEELGADTLIGLCVDRNEDMIFGMLGILKAGAAYVPVDPQYPQDRINYIINHSQASLLLTHKKQDELGIEFAKDSIIYMDDAAITQSPYFLDKKTDHRINPKDTAYVLYTSGSTGRPKGVSVTHENVNCLFESLDKQFDLTDKDIWSLFHTFCFDISVWEIWGAFLYGGTLVVIPYETTRDPKKFYELIASENVTVLTQTASAFQMFINQDLQSKQKLDHLRYVGFVGESLKVSILRPWAKKYGTDKPRLANLYGITETTVYTNCKFVNQQDIDKGRDNIGWPLEEFSMCVLDETNQWCPVGIVGEICIGGRGLSRGYLYRDDLTQEKFFPDPYAEYLGLPENTLLYRTGDLGRWMADGSIEYLGRKDFQVKLRGFRIELGEIEAALGSYVGITHTVVLLKGEGDSSYLSAYYTVKPDIQIEKENLIRHLKSFLPEYMVPSIVTELPSFPMTVNGKIDRRVLNEYQDSRCTIQEIKPLSGPLERAVAEIWARVLRVPLEAIGSNINFFDLGGNSLLVVKMLTQVTNKLGLDFALNRFIASPTIATLSAQAESQEDTAQTVQDFCERLQRDCLLDASIQPLQQDNLLIEAPKVILVTGVTGFLGAHMLSELLEKTNARIYCLVRATSTENAMQKIIAKQEQYKIYQAQYRTRIVPVLGDLAQNKLGLSDHDYELLASEVDSIMHVGAWVHHIYDYKTLYPSNVASVKEALKLSVYKKNKAMHFISTLVTGTVSPVERLPLLDSNTAEAQLSFNGYVSGKWVAEQLLKEAHARGIVAHVYRPGNIIASVAHGVYEPEDNHTLMRLKGLLQLGQGFVQPDEQVEMMPVDLLAQAIIEVSKNPKLFCYNMNNAQTISWKNYLQIAQDIGFEFNFIEDEAAWNTVLTHLDETNAFYKLSVFYKTREKKIESKPMQNVALRPDYLIHTPSYNTMIIQQLKALLASGFLEKQNKA